VAYVDRHPFDLTGEAKVRLFWISNDIRGQAKELTLLPNTTVRQAVLQQVAGAPVLEDGLTHDAGDFRVEIDGVELRRPITFDYVRVDKRGLEKALLFVGKYAPDLGKVSDSLRGGELSLEGYLFWNGRIVPKENNGVLVRIRGTSGSLFDASFFKYQVSEQTRLRQITSELFIRSGLDPALNIDRESFNFSHPHVQLVALWLHRALRQLTNRHKDISKQARLERRSEDSSAAQDEFAQIAMAIWARRKGDDALPEVRIVDSPEAAGQVRRDGSIALLRSSMPSLSAPRDSWASRDAFATLLAQILAAFDVLEDRPYDEQQHLIDALLTAFFAVPSA
jgi:hypothetical protein